MTISQRIFEIMRQKKISQTELAQHLNIPPSTVSSWKNNNSAPPSDKLVDIAERLDVNVLELLGTSSDFVVDNNEISVKFDNPFNNELVWKAYGHLSEKEKLQVQVYILDLAEKSEHSAAEVRIVEG